MGSFSCPHFDVAADFCLLLKTDCVPGEERIRARAAKKNAQRHVYEKE